LTLKLIKISISIPKIKEKGSEQEGQIVWLRDHGNEEKTTFLFRPKSKIAINHIHKINHISSLMT